MKKFIFVFVFISIFSCYGELKKLDINGDGVITKEEFKGSFRFFNFLDINKDGKITKDEIIKAKAKRKGRIYSEKVEIIKDVVYGKVDDKELLLDIVKPKETSEIPMPVIVFVHGGGWTKGDKKGGDRKLIPFAEKGYFCVSINYRLAPESKFPAQIEDCKCAIRFLKANSKKYNINPEKIGVWGTSAGGHLVSLLGTTGNIDKYNESGGWYGYSSKVSAVCDWFGPTDFLSSHSERSGLRGKFLLSENVKERRKLMKEASPVYYVSKESPPFLIMHGGKDTIVPFKQSEILYSKLKEKGVDVTLIKLKEAGHGICFGSREVRYVEAFFNYYLKGEKEEWEKLRINDFIELD